MWGANIADTALVCALGAGPKGKVWAIEPHPVTFEYLRGNIALNKSTNIKLVNAAVGETKGEVTFGNGRRDDMNRVGDDGIVVQMDRLDELVEAEKIALLKIDVEGYELQVLRGSPKILAGTNCVYFEVSRQLYSNFGYEIPSVLRFLEEAGFQLCRPGSSGTVTAIDSQFDTDEVENLIAARDRSDFLARTGWTPL